MSVATITQSNRSLEIQTPLGENVLGLRSILVQEQLGRPYVIEAELSSDSPDVQFDAIIGHPVVIRLDLGGGGRRFYHGFVSRFVLSGHGPTFTHYRATIVPWLWVMTRSADCRIFQDMNVPEIVQNVFADRGAKDVELRITGTYPKRTYCVQYRETDFNFVSRLLEEEGITYFFKQEDEKVTLVLVDDMASYETIPDPGELRFTPFGGNERQMETITQWSAEQELQPTQYSLSDYNYLKPKTSLLKLSQVEKQHAINDRQIFDFPGDYLEPAEGERLTRTRLEEIQTGAEIVRAETTFFGLSAGHLFTLKEHPREEQNRKYLLTSVNLYWDAGEFTTQAEGTPQSHCHFTAIPATQTFRPARVTPKPLIQGPQSAMVVGPAGEEIHTDEHGRVKVHFFWNRESKGDDKSSAWVRVSQSWAGKKWGTFFLPRIGHEVLVEFIEGDPDRPVVTGSVYNADNKPPYDLPANKTKSMIKTLSSKGGGGYNELRFEDMKGCEEIFLHAEKNLEVRVKAAHQESVGGVRDLHVHGDTRTKLHAEHHLHVVGNEYAAYDADRHLKVTGNTQTKIDGNLSLEVGSDRMTKIVGTDSLKVEQDLSISSTGVTSISASDIYLKAGGNIGLDAKNIHLKASSNIVIEAGSNVTLVVGGDFIAIGGGIKQVGSTVKINSGGSPASGAGCSPLDPAAPDPPDPKDPGGPPTGKPGEVTTFSSAAQALKYAALTGLPFCEECPREQPPPSPGPDVPPPDVPEITSVALIDADNAEVSGGEQIVNLPAEDKWVDAEQGITSKFRLGPALKVKVNFSLPGAHSFKLRLVPGDDNLVYTDPELGRNARFKHQTEEKTYSTGGDGTKVIEPGDIFISVAGGQSFKLEAENPATGTVVESGEIVSKRLGYVVPVLMEGMDATVLGLSGVYSEFANHGLQLVELPLVRIPSQPNIGSDAETNQFKAACKTAFNGSSGAAKKPYALTLGFTEHLAVKHANVDLVLTGWPVGPEDQGGLNAEIPVEATGLREGDEALSSRALWQNLVPGEGWYVTGSYTPEDGGAAVPITEAMCTPIPVDPSRPDLCFDVEVDTSTLPVGVGTLRLRVNVVDRMRAGLAFDGNLACACLKAWWQDQSSDEIMRAVIHEIGHKVDMVTDGTGKKPDRVPTHYIDRGHVGDHCHNGLPLQDSYSGVSSGNICVMFGTITDQDAFCPDCAKAVKKMDLTAGWPPA